MQKKGEGFTFVPNYIDHPDESAESLSVCAHLLCLQQLHLILIKVFFPDIAKSQSSAVWPLWIHTANCSPELHCSGAFSFFACYLLPSPIGLKFLMPSCHMVDVASLSYLTLSVFLPPFFCHCSDLSDNAIMSVQANAFSQMKNLQEL